MTREVYNLEDYFDMDNRGYNVRNYFKRVRTGQSDDYRTPFWKERPREDILDEWFHILKKNSLSRAIPGLLDFEADMRSKVGPLSVMKPLAERVEDVVSYYKEIELPSIPIEPRAVAAFLSKVRKVRVKPWSHSKTIENMRLSTNSGAPYFTRRRKVVNETMKDLIFEDKVEDMYPAILGWRGQEGGPDIEDVKQRVVWMFPFMYNVQELTVYTPLIKAWQALNINSAYISMRAVEEKITALFDSKDDNYVIVTDFTKFDQHFNKDMQQGAFAALCQMVPQGRDWLRYVFPIKYNIPIAISEHVILSGAHGMGSGSGGTNFDECCAHSMLQEEAAILRDTTLNPYSNAYGDDGILSYDGIDVDDVIDTYESHGQEMNPSKQSVSKHSAVYLRRYFHDSYRDRHGVMLGIYSTCRAIGRLMGQERYWDKKEVGYEKYLTLRAWSILENCNQHPAFDELVEFVIEGDKYRLGLDIPGFMEGFQKDFDKLRELDPDVLGYTKTLQSGQHSVKDWRIYKALRRYM